MRSTPWRALIADDEPAARRGVRQLLQSFPDFAVAGECRDGGEVLAALETNTPDVVFLDVQMPGLDGFDVIRRRTRERMPAVVFLTAYDEFAIRAFEEEALDYLLKPVTEARFAATMSRLRRHLELGHTSTSTEPSIVVTTSKGVSVFALRDVDWIESADNYVRVWTGGKGYLLRESLNDLEERVRPHGLVRAHRRALVRIGGVRKLATNADGEMIAVLTSGAQIPVARRRRAAFAAAVRAQTA